MKHDKEYRNNTGTVTAKPEGRTVEGYALLFDTPSDGLPWKEIIARGALDGILSVSDVKCWLNHNEDRGLLARWPMKEGSLHLEVDNRGLLYRFGAPETSLGDELLANIQRGEVNESSFAFIVEAEEWKNIDDPDPAKWERTITKIGQLFDVSPVYDAAYSATSVYARSIEAVEAEVRSEKKDPDQIKAPEPKQEPELEPVKDSYYEELKKYIDF